MRRVGWGVLTVIGHGVVWFFTVLMHIGSGLKGGRSTDETARKLYEKPTEYRP